MAANDYHFITHWQVTGTCAEVWKILADPLTYPQWWREVFVEVRSLEESGSHGGAVSVQTQGFLPYRLRWEARPVALAYPHGIALEVIGDFVGRGIWALRQEGATVHITFDWRVRTDKPVVRWLSRWLRPLFAANHRWAMRRGAEGLRQELTRFPTPADLPIGVARCFNATQ